MFVNHAIVKHVGRQPSGSPSRKSRWVYEIVDVSPEFFDPKPGIKIGDYVTIHYKDVRSFKYQRYHNERNTYRPISHISSMVKYEGEFECLPKPFETKSSQKATT